MMLGKPFFRLVLALGLITAVCATIFLGVRWMRHKQLVDQVVSAMRISDRRAQWEAFARLRDTNRLEAARITLGLLTDPDQHIRLSAVRSLGFLYPPMDVPMPADVADRLAEQLRGNSDPNVRLGCAINLGMRDRPTVRAAFIAALRDPYDMVVRIACTEVGHRPGPGAKEALLAVLDNPSWNARLEACKGLIIAKEADARVVAALEKMSTEPEAAKYDALMEEFDKREKEVGGEAALGKRWGKLGIILEEARAQANARK